MEKILITTALEETWDREKSIIFLGTWCKLYNRRHTWENTTHETVNYVWDDRTQFEKDYYYLRILSEKILTDLASKLNKLHRVNYSVQYWKIIVMPWLNMFVQITFERWVQLVKAFNDYSIDEVYIDPNGLSDFVPTNKTDFVSNIISDEWNYKLYSEIINYQNKDNNKLKYLYKPITIENKNKVNNTFSYKSKIQNKIKRIIDFVLKSNNSIAITDIGISASDKLKLIIKKRQNLFQVDEAPIIEEKSEEMRHWKLDLIPNDEFENFLVDFIPNQIPIAYIEAYVSIKGANEKFYKDYNPYKIVATDVYYNEFLKNLIAIKKESGCKLIIPQHGGSYGLYKWSINEDYELDIADEFISWGWQKDNSTVINPLGLLKTNPFNNWKKNESDQILLVLGAWPRYSYKLGSEPVGGQWEKYINDQIDFISRLDINVRSKLIVKLHSKDYGWNIDQRILDKFPAIKITKNVPIQDSLDVKLVICTYNGTTFLETLSNHVPTIIFWDEAFWEIRDNALEHINSLKKAGIFHNSSLSVANFINKNESDIEMWWNSTDVIQVRNEFIQCYSKKLDNPLCYLLNKYTKSNHVI